MFDREWRLLRNTGVLDADKQARLQQRRLWRVLMHAWQTVPFYSEHMPAPPGSGRALDWLAAVPVLEKAELKSRTNEFISSKVPKGKTSATSGTSGQPMVVEHSPKSEQRRFAYLADHARLCGLEDGHRSVRLSGRLIADPSAVSERPWLHVPSERQLLVSTYHLDRRHKAVISRKLNEFRPVVLDGYPSAIKALLELTHDSVEWATFLQACITTAETLTPDVRERIEELAGAPVANYYSASEGIPFIQQCLHGTYHVRWQSGVFEVLTENGLRSEGSGELVVTSFTQDRMPLIRYRTGDFVEGLRAERGSGCPCGLCTPTVDGVVGRVEDMVTLRDGGRMGMFSYRTLKDLEGVERAQVVQRGVEEFVLRVVPEEGACLEEIGELAEANFRQVLGYKVRVNVERIEAMPVGPNGKTRLVINETVQ